MRILSLVPGGFVQVQGVEWGVGKLLDIHDGSARVEWFTSIARHKQDPFIQTFPKSKLNRAGVAPQTRCYVCDEWGDNWRMGRVLSVSGANSDVHCEVHIGGGDTESFPEAQVWARCLLEPADPVETLAHRVQETPFFYERRRALRRNLVQQRALAHGLTGLLSSRVLLLPHQVGVVQRVLEDPVQRYLLADEVGLGKTIEAGAIIRQLRCDEPKAPVLVVVPPALKGQWKRELEEKLCLPVDDLLLRVVGLDEVEKSPHYTYGLVVMDEAHHIAAARRTRPPLWERACQLAHESPRLLLLSATPALNNEADFLAMLHLLEPQSYALDNLDGFRRLVANRQPIGNFLMSFAPGLNRFRARSAVSNLRELFPDDALIQRGADEIELCRDAEEWPQERADELVREVRLRISESYRLHRRLLRTARSEVELPPEILAPRAEGEDALVTCEWSEDERAASVYGAFIEWREAAAGALWSLTEAEREAQIDPLAEVGALLAFLSASWLEPLGAALHCRLGLAGADAVRQNLQSLDDASKRTLLTAPLFEGEDAYLRAILKVLDDEAGEDAIDTLGSILTRMARQAVQKIVVFASATATACAIAERLRGQVGMPLYLHAASTEDCSVAAVESLRVLQRFRDEPGSAVLICDRIGEEGLNFQFADVVWHFDLPWDPNRLEQRVGRLDRIGHATPLRSRVLVGYNGTDDMGEESLHEAWFSVLNEGFELFKQSVADLQFYTDAKMPHLKRAALLEGATGMRAQLSGMKEEIKAERQKLKEQNWLDNLEAVETDAGSFFAGFTSLDEKVEEVKSTLDDWASEVLKFRRVVSQPDVLQYRASDRTLLPAEWTQRLEAAQRGANATNGWSTYSRETACEGAPKQLLRLGAPFVDQLHELLLWDDRGQAYALWRFIEDWTGDDGFYFRFDYVIETDVRAVRAPLEEQGWSGERIREAERSLARRADSWFAPRFITAWIDSEGRLLTASDPAVAILKRPCEKRSIYGRDYNLDADRLWALDELIAPDLWPDMCRTARSRSESLVRQNANLRATCTASGVRARHEMERRLEQVKRGMTLRSAWGFGGGSVEDTMKNERELFESLACGIETPRVTLDAVGFYVLSGRNPFVDEGAAR